MLEFGDGQRVNVSIVRGVMVASLQQEPAAATLDLLRGDLLNAASRQRARGLVLDLSGIPGLDTQVMAHLQATTAMLKLMGVASLFAGLRPGVVAALAVLSLEWTKLPCAVDVDSAVDHFSSSEESLS